MPLNFQWRSGSGSATQSFSSEWEWECHSKNKGVLNPLLRTQLSKIYFKRKMNSELRPNFARENAKIEHYHIDNSKSSLDRECAI